jgi:hypothetical protein
MSNLSVGLFRDLKAGSETLTIFENNLHLSPLLSAGVYATFFDRISAAPKGDVIPLVSNSNSNHTRPPTFPTPTRSNLHSIPEGILRTTDQIEQGGFFG